MIETIKDKNTIVAIIVYKGYHNDGIMFLTPEDFSLQLGYMSRPAGYRVVAHKHNTIKRQTIGTQEVLFIKSGVIRIDFYSFEQVYLGSRNLSTGDMILLVGAGHGITVLEPAIIVEVKNGPYLPGADKERFEGKGGNVGDTGKPTAS